MKRLLSVFVILIMIFSLVCCEEKVSADTLMSEFLRSYGIDGVVYSSSAKEGDVGYASGELLSKLFIFEGDFPESYALLLNARSDNGTECGFFVCENEGEREQVIDMCEERLSLLTRGEGGIIISRGRVVFYSSLSDSERAENCARRIISKH